jgi:hypothetical protein
MVRNIETRAEANNQAAHGRRFEHFVRQVRSWVSDENARAQVLEDWLQGIGVPAEVYGWNPAEWLYRSLDGPDRVEFRRKMALRLVPLFEKEPQAQPTAKLPNDFLENLFNLAALLEDSAHLGPPLLALFGRLQKNPGPLQQDTRLQVAFRSALAHNQGGFELRDVWLDLIRRKEVPVISGGQFGGLEGFLLMPMHEHTFDDAVFAVGQFANSVKHSRFKRRILCAAIELTQKILQDQRLAGIEFAKLAGQGDFPQWAAECSPTMFERAHTPQRFQQRARFLMWDRFAHVALGLLGSRISVRASDSRTMKIVEAPSSVQEQIVEWVMKWEEIRKEACKAGVSDHEFSCRTLYFATSGIIAENYANQSANAIPLENIERMRIENASICRASKELASETA